ncbi:ABC transporter substrate-binding protein [Cetobacterium somerae]|uniref:ABC transporter substrate-binding protein n=1 Tax=Cetobacterium sp. NK01 TaxID=2993530 RepID=UPI002115F8A6|nr:ABC transporter substrate-binding protein [Cetobacterium sp. NK01]MCQ8212803.1 ABC transporter substrate-binding protein [Cetobacterium sp. NK01]
MRRVHIFLFYLFTISILAFSATINIVQEGDPRTFDPHFGNDGFSLRINRLLYSRLLEKNSNMETVFGVAKSYKFIDNKTIDFTLKDNVFFQNGDKLTSEDVKFSFDRMKKSPRIAGVLPPIKEIIIKDDYHFQMILEKPFSGIIDQLTHPALSIVSKNYLTKDSGILVEKPMGSGKYILDSWTPGEGVVLKRFENYFDTKPYYEKIDIKTIPLATNRTIALETGEADIAFSLPPQDEKTVTNNPNLKFISKPSYSYTYMGLNLKKDIFKNPDIRKGINLAIDKETILEVVLNGEGEIANSPVAKGVKGYNPNLKNLGYDKEEASKLLAPLKNKTLTLATMSSNLDIQTAEIIAGYLNDLGIEVQITVLEPSIYWVKTNNGEFDMFIGSWGSVTGDSDYALYPTHHSSAFGAPGNRTFFSDEKVDKLLEQARETLDKNKREEIYQQIQEIIVDNNSEVMLFYRDLNGALNKKVQGFEMYPIPIHDYSLGTIH